MFRNVLFEGFVSCFYLLCTYNTATIYIPTSSNTVLLTLCMASGTVYSPHTTSTFRVASSQGKIEPGARPEGGRVMFSSNPTANFLSTTFFAYNVGTGISAVRWHQICVSIDIHTGVYLWSFWLENMDVLLYCSFLLPPPRIRIEKLVRFLFAPSEVYVFEASALE